MIYMVSFLASLDICFELCHHFQMFVLGHVVQLLWFSKYECICRFFPDPMPICLMCGSAPQALWKGRFCGTYLFWPVLGLFGERERNGRCFEGVASPLEYMIHSVKFCVASWASILTQFWSLSPDCIVFKWREVAALW